jgi:hypothetical protein
MRAASGAGVRQRENRVVGLLLGQPGSANASRAGHYLGYALENKREGGLGRLGEKLGFGLNS